jgi:hypothetical protein
LSTTKAAEDYVYFTIPYTFISYPFSWVLPMVIIALALFIFLLFIGRAKRILSFREISRGFIPLLGSIVVVGLITFFGWKALLKAYPQYNDLLNGFTYNGHDYIAAFVLLGIAISFGFYQRFSTKKITMNHYVAPLFLWIIINIGLAFSLQGAGFLIIPVYFGLFTFGTFIITQKSNKLLNLIFGIPALLLIAPFIQMFPIGLGLKVLFGSAILTVLAFGLLLPVFGAFAKKGRWSLLFFILAIGFFVKAHFSSGYELGTAKSNSLLYVYNTDTNKASWMTYDTNLDSWTKSYLGDQPKEATGMEDTPLFSKYNSKFTYQANAPIKALEKPTIEFLDDRILGNQRYLKIRVSPNRKVNRYDIFANEKMTIHNFKANGASTLGQKGSKYPRNGKKILSYYVVDNLPLEMQFSIDATTNLDMALMESSFDLLINPLFSMRKREDWMMPTPFILNDAVVIKEKIKPSPVVAVVKPVVTPTRNYIKKEPLKIATDSLKVPKI